jgi:hypothetical protein
LIAGELHWQKLDVASELRECSSDSLCLNGFDLLLEHGDHSGRAPGQRRAVRRIGVCAVRQDPFLSLNIKLKPTDPAIEIIVVAPHAVMIRAA